MNINTRELTAKAVLTHAKEIIETKGWTQSHYARNQRGEPVGFKDDEASCFCTAGAINRSIFDLIGEDDYMNCYLSYKGGEHPYDVLGKTGYVDSGNVYIWNDYYNRTKEDVIALFDQAIDVCEFE